jgi:hypothetical protein
MVSGPTRGDSILDIYLVRPESSFISCKVVPRISDHNGVLLEADWAESCHRSQVVREIPLYHKTDTPGLQAFLREKFRLWAGSGSCVDEILISFKEIIYEGIKRHVPKKKTLSKNPDPEYYNTEVKRLKVKVRKEYNRSKYNKNNQADCPKSYCWQKRRLRKHVYVRSFTTKADVGQSSTSMLKGVEETEKTFWRSRTRKANSSQKP